MQTPPRPSLPGTWLQTPAGKPPPPAPSFSGSLRRDAEQPHYAAGPGGGPNMSLARVDQNTSSQLQQSNGVERQPPRALSSAERAARAINESLESDSRFPELDSYLSRESGLGLVSTVTNLETDGYSYEYDLKSAPPWAPFQKVRVHNIPDQIFEQYNRAAASTSMGLFAEIHYAWVAIDNALYMWDYTVPNPQLLGYEGQSSLITAVKLATPRVGVFLPSIKHIIVLATISEVMILGLGPEDGPGDSKSLSLFQTGISVSVRGLDISAIATSNKNGRIFFGGRTENHLYELKYFRDERWFKRRFTRVCHTWWILTPLAAPLNIGKDMSEYVEQLAVDDSRDLVYTLSSHSAVRVFYMTDGGSLSLALTRSAAEIYSSVGHIITPNGTLNAKVKIVSISPIPSEEAQKFHLVATTSTGYRIYLSATSEPSWVSARSGAPMNMQAQHVKLPPVRQSSGQGLHTSSEQRVNVNDSIQTLITTRLAARYPPGYFFCFYSANPNQPNDMLFVSAPDPARLARPLEVGQPSRSAESAIWLRLGSRAEDVGLCSPYRPPTKTPMGFGNELAVQFDAPTPEVAILTNTGIHILRRRRLVDGFVALVQHDGGPEGLDGEVKNFISTYGRTQTLATALAVACGQGVEVSPDSRITRVSDPEVLEAARKVFIEYGGKPTINQNSIVDQSQAQIDTVRPSPRHAAISLYLSRLLRSTWRAVIAKEDRTPTGGYAIAPGVPLSKIKSVQEDLSALQRFFQTNKSFIKGLSGPDSLTRSYSKQDELALQGEHRALNSVVKFVSDVIEGLSFIMVLFDERVEEIVPLLSEESRPLFLQLTFEALFSSSKGFELAKELVKAIVNRNIAKGSNVETIAEALRRRCGSFCSAEDVVIFKAQELLKRASEVGSTTEFGKNLLNESLALFQQAAGNLPMDYLESAVKQFTSLQFFAGAIQLALKVANESDKANEAASWIADGRPATDPRRTKYELRSRCYDLVHEVINEVDRSMENEPAFVDGRPSLTATRRNEAYDVISRSTDEVFLTNLYDWYLLQGWTNRLLATDSPFIVTYLERKSADDVAHADLLWKYYGQSGQYYDAACVQLQLAKSGFDLSLDRRIEYLSRARANASTYTQGGNRKSKQKLLQEISEFLDVANLQDEILQRLKDDPRLPAERRTEVLSRVNGPVLSITEVRYSPSGRDLD
jgi:nuclear pore complex protein Nup155